MDCPLCVVCPIVGFVSESFVRRHVQELFPGRTAVIALRRAPEAERDWDHDGPLLLLEDTEFLPWRAIARAARLGPARAWDDARTTAFLERHGVRVVLGEYLDCSLSILLAAKRAGIRAFAHAHGYDVSARLRQVRWAKRYRALNQLDGVVTVAQDSVAKLEAAGISARYSVVPCGADGVDAPPAVRQGKTVRFASVGRMVAKKAPQNSVRAFAQACASAPNLALEMVGDGPLLGHCQALATVLGVADRVKFHGAQPHSFVLGLLGESDAFVLPSIRDPHGGDEEGLPVAILEAMGRGLPVLATRHAGIPEAVGDGATGFLVEEGDVSAIAARMLELAADAELRHRMGVAAWERWRSGFSWEHERRRLVDLLGLGEDS